MEKKVIGIAICDNGGNISFNKRIPIRLQPCIDYVKRTAKNSIIITTVDSYTEVMRVFSPKDIVTITRDNKKVVEGVKNFNTLEAAIKYVREKSGSKAIIPIICGPTFNQYIIDEGFYDEFVKIRIDVDFGNENTQKLDIDFSYYELLKQPEELYCSGYSYWYEVYDMTNKLDKPKVLHMNLEKLENLEIED